MFSEGLRRLIISMLQEDQNRRPNIYQVLNAVCHLRGLECPIRDVSRILMSDIGYLFKGYWIDLLGTYYYTTIWSAATAATTTTTTTTTNYAYLV
ncbi:hypothetical protein G6F42_029040 [Rhizopus arrhizus]|nr:hypothetical protein G6F42_029040 [Rhizopus arrhizus]